MAQAVEITYLLSWMVAVGVIVALGHRRDVWRTFRTSMLAQWKPALAVTVLFELGMGHLAGESITNGVPQSLRTHRWSAFFLLLAGAGLAEDTPLRLVLIPLVWRLSGRRWVAVTASAVLFGACHLTPLNTQYQTYWQHPVSQFASATLAGALLGCVVVLRGHETTVLGHTLSDWIPLLLTS